MSNSELHISSDIPSSLLDECKAIVATIDNLCGQEHGELQFFQQTGGLFNFLIRISTPCGDFYFKKYRDDVKPTLFSPPRIPATERALLAYRVQTIARDLAGDLCFVVPKILAFRSDSASFVMDGAPTGCVPLIEYLIEGNIPSEAVEVLPKFLARLHKRGVAGDYTDTLFLNTKFRDFKLNLQYEDIASFLGGIWADVIRNFVALYKTQRKCIVHGDINSRNILICKNAHPSLSVIDYEQSHIGEQTFDIGYILCEFLISTLFFGRTSERCLAMRSFLEHYFSEYGDCDRANLEKAITIHTACQGIYRFIGPSRKHWTSYISQEAQEDIVNELRAMIDSAPRSISSFL